MILQNKNAVIYGASESVGGAVAKAFAEAGATVFLSGKNPESVEKAAALVKTAGGKAETAIVDALDEKSINDYLDSIVAKAGTIDVSFNLIGIQDVQDIALVNMDVEDFLRPVAVAMRSQFLTAAAAGRIMIKQQSGVILSLTATPGGVAYPLVGGFGPACCAIEGFSRDLATELGPSGIRVLNIRSAGSPDSRPFKEAMAQNPGLTKNFLKELEADTMLKRLPLMEDIANTAVFLASDLARQITGVVIDVTGGTTNGLNYKSRNIPFVKE